MDSEISPEKKIVTVRGLKVWLRIKGSGTPLLILEGWGGFADKYYPLQDKLSAMGYEVLLPELPGLPGQTASTYIPCQEWPAWVQELLKGATQKPFMLVSHSLSARIAAQYLTTQDSNCLGSIFISPWLVSSNRGAFLLRVAGTLVRYLSPLIFSEMKWVRDSKAWATAFSLLSVIKEQQQPATNCLVIWGKSDLMRPLLRGWRKLRCKDRQFEWDHSPQIRATDELAAAIHEFASARLGQSPTRKS